MQPILLLGTTFRAMLACAAAQWLFRKLSKGSKERNRWPSLSLMYSLGSGPFWS